MSDLISRQAAIDALRKALYDYEDKTEKQFIESDELDINDWIQHRIFVQNMSDIDRQTIQNLPTIEAEPVKHGRWKPFDLTWGRSVYACTNCGEAFEVPTEDGKPIYDYRPNCGARMDEPEKQIRELKEENARLHRQLLREKAIRYKLFTLVPPERLAELLRENPEQYQ